MAAVHIEVLHPVAVPYIGAGSTFNGDIVEGINVEEFHV
jgi:hypothetical protein